MAEREFSHWSVVISVCQYLNLLIINKNWRNENIGLLVLISFIPNKILLSINLSNLVITAPEFFQQRRGVRYLNHEDLPSDSKTEWNATGKIFLFHAILVIKRDKSRNKLIKVIDLPTEQVILQQSICFWLNYSKKEATVQPLAPVQPLVRLPYIFL